MARERKIKVPKEIAGVKVPKKVRKAGNRALEFADHPAALELAAAALSAAAAALQAKGRKRRAEDVTPRLAELGRAQATGDGDNGSPAQEVASQLGDIVRAAALEGARRLLDGVGKPKAAAPATDTEPAAALAAPAKSKRRKANGARSEAAAQGD